MITLQNALAALNRVLGDALEILGYVMKFLWAMRKRFRLFRERFYGTLRARWRKDASKRLQ
jgi:hypothetical protein